MPEPPFIALPVSPTVRRVVGEFSSESVTAAALAGAVLAVHPEYGGGRTDQLELDREAGASAPVELWLDLVLGTREAAAWRHLDGRRLVLGLARLDHRLASSLSAGGFLAALEGELHLSPPEDIPALPPEEVPPLPTARPAHLAWREGTLVRVAELKTLVARLRPRTQQSEAVAEALTASVGAHLQAAERAAVGGRGLLTGWITGSDLERATANLGAAEADILRLAPLSYVQAQLASIVAAVQRHLAPDDPRRMRVEGFARRGSDEALREYERDALVNALHAARSASRREVTRVRSFRNMLLVATALLTTVAIGIAVVGIVDQSAAPLCFTATTEVVCPTDQNPVPVSASPTGGIREAPEFVVDRVTRRTTSPWDVVVIELVGLVAAALAGAAALRNIRGTSTPYSLPVALALLKLPAGALCAVLGLLLMRGQFIPGLSALDSPGQIVAWGIVFGYAQQLLTRRVDQQARAVLDDVGDVAPRAAPEGAAVTPETLASAVAAVRSSLARPSLINYDGFLSVRVLDPKGEPVPDDGEGAVALRPEAPYRLEVTIDLAPMVGARNARVSIQQGEVAEVVPFGVELDSDRVALRAPGRDVQVNARGGEQRLEFPLTVGEGMGDASVWVRVAQHGRLIQLVEVELEVGAPVG